MRAAGLQITCEIISLPARIADDPAAAANAVALNYSTDTEEGILRQRHGKSFTYATTAGTRVRDRATLARIRALSIPPAWTRVWISPDPDGHIQATGRDARGRKQYRYHPRWREVRDAVKYHRLVDFCRARQNGSYGATTLRNRHVTFQSQLTFELSYRGKSAALLSCALDYPGTERTCKKCVKAALEQVADRLGHTPTICRTSCVHPRLIEDFTANRLAATLVPLVRRRLRHHETRDQIAVEALRQIEPAVARYLATSLARRRA